MLFLRRLVTGFVLSFILWAGISIGALGVGGAIVGVEVAKEHNATDFQSGYAAGQSAGREFGRRYGHLILLGSFAVAVVLAVGGSFSPLLPWCRVRADRPAPESRSGKILDLVTGGVLISITWIMIAVFIILGMRRRAGGNIAMPQAAASPVGPLASFNPQAVRDAKVEAVRLYPDLAVAGSRMNAEYVARYDRYRTQNPGYFLDTNWPLTLADETATALAAGRSQDAGPSASAAVTGSSSQVLQPSHL